MRIAVGGFQHETNTFAPGKTSLGDFERADAWPALVEGTALAEALGGMNIPVSGFLERARALNMAIAPTLWCSATPSARVTDHAFESICGRLTRAIGASLPLDAVYLDLHGAMVSESHDDAEGEVLRRVREVVGERVPVVASLDLHANVSADMLACADLLVSYRTYPHVDMADTGARAADLVATLLASGRRPEKALRQIPFLIPLTWQYTGMEPMRGLMADVDDAPSRGAISASFTAGFPPADVADCGPSVFAYADERANAVAIADHVAATVRAAEADFRGRTWKPDEAVQEAMRLSERGTRPVVLADTQDNPGAGGSADTTGLLRALVRNGARDAVLAVMCDPAVAAQAHAAGAGANISVRLGAWSGFPGDTPFEATMRVEALADGAVQATGSFYAGAHIMLGRTALLRTGGVRVVVASYKCQAADRAMLRHVGMDPAAQRVLALKSSVHFRADFEAIAGAILVVLAPGPNVADPARLAYRRLRPGVRLGPMGLPFRPQAGSAEVTR